MKLTRLIGNTRWDSSDPDRAPPPLPLNPASSSSPVTKPNTSANVAAAAEAFAAKARESMYTINPMPSKSPEKSLMKGQYHKRMQSIQNPGGHIRDLSSYLENPRSPERSPERQSRPSFDIENRSPDRSSTRPGTPTPLPKDLKDMPNLRPTRPPPKAILGENTPQSATMLALQNTPTPKEVDSSLSNITNGSTALVRTPQSFEAISTQILSLTGIATNLQREMTQLSRRSKDNATDLISLKEATNARDEDIRKSLRDLVLNLKNQAENGQRNTNQYLRSPGSYLLEDKPHVSPVSMTKSVSLPRIPSPTSFAASIEREIASSPVPYSSDGAASIALLEKILREMGTKEGQERLLVSLSEIKNRTSTKETDPVIAKKLEEILDFLKDNSGSRALVARRDNGNGSGSKPPQLELNFENPGSMPLARSQRNITPYGSSPSQGADGGKTMHSTPKAIDFVSEDILKMLKRMKDSITEGGGMSAEIKALVRELRGEVLGMGREIGRKLDQAESTMQSNSKNEPSGPGREEITEIVEDGLARLKEHMDRVMHEQRRQSSASAISRSAVNSQEVYLAVKNALQEMPIQQPGSGIEREEILEAVREAWETYKPEIELQNFGLERDEILQCLKEGLEDYKPQGDSKELSGATYEEVLEAVQEGLKSFKPPAPVETDASITKDEILTTVRECLESYEFTNPNFSRERELEMTREDVLEAVKEGLSAQAPVSRELEVNRDDIFDAIKAGFEGAPTPMGGVGEQVLEKMQDLIDGMRGEFKQYSSANGRDTEQVLDAMKDGLEVLRAGIETYVDRAADVTGKDEIIETVRDGLEHLRIDLEDTIANAPRGSGNTDSGELLDAMEKEFEHLRQTIAISMVRSGGSTSDKDEILDTLRDGMDEIRRGLPPKFAGSEEDTITAMKEEFEHLRETLATTLTRSGSSIDKDDILDTIKDSLDRFRMEHERDNGRPESILSNTSELLDAFNDGLDNLKADIQKIINTPQDMTVNYEILDTLKEGLQSVRADIDRLYAAQVEQESVSGRRGGEVVIAGTQPPGLQPPGLERTDIENLEVMITQLRIKVESMDNLPVPPPEPSQPAEGTTTKDDIDRLAALMEDVQSKVANLAERELAEDNAATKEDIDAIETLLRNTKAQLDEMVFPETEGLVRVENLVSLEAIMKSTRDAVEDLAVRQEVDTSSKTDVGILESLLKEVRVGMEEMRDRVTGEAMNKSDIEALEAVCTDTKSRVEDLVLPALADLPCKSEFDTLGSFVKDFQEKMEAEADLTAQAFEARKIEHGGIADKVEDVKAFLEDVRKELRSKVENNAQGLETLAEILNNVNASVLTLDATASIKELMDIVNRGFDQACGSHEAAKAETEQHRDLILGKHNEVRDAIVADLAAKIDTRFDDLMIKYDDAQAAADAKANFLNEKDGEQTEALTATRTIAEDLKILIDALGASVTESCDRMAEDSKTVFNRVEDISAKLDASTNSLTTAGNADHQLTRAELSKTLVAIEGVQAHAVEYHPKILGAIGEVLSIVGQHYEQAQRSSEEIKEIKTSVEAIPSSISIQAITGPLPSPSTGREMLPPPEKYDDSEVHAKLDKIVDNAAQAGQATAHVELLEQIKSQVEGTAAEFAAFVALQQAAIIENQQSHSREVEEAAIALEKRTAQKEQVEADIIRLSDEKLMLSTSVDELKKEEHDLALQKAKLQADLSSLETALQIRREEMHLMEAKAEGLERRILEGVLDHSRSLLMTSRPQSSLKSMNLKRVGSTASNATTATKASTAGTTVPSTVGSAASQGLNMALKRRQPTRSNAGAPNSNHNRRILSLSTIGSNKAPTSDRSIVLANPSLAGSVAKSSTAFGNGGLKRSHSVKSNFPSRKTSWGGTRQGGMYADDLEEEDKENSILDEEDEEGSEGGTERRTSLGTESLRKTSYSGTYTDTGSYGTGSVDEDERRSSYAASTEGTLGLMSEKDAEEGDGDDQERGVVVYGMPTDSGIGSSLPTAGLEGGGEYFKE
ncbi:hypothetical protein MMC30_003923 [Trapelia coarctata]|nr:hypothetical protein [Trapelia coarctata]